MVSRRCSKGLSLTFAFTPGWRIVPIPPQLAADIEPTDLGLRHPAADHQAQGMLYALGHWLTDAERFRRADGRDTHVGLHHQPQAREPSPEGPFRHVRRCAGRDGELEGADQDGSISATPGLSEAASRTWISKVRATTL
jgi:hypothetical protein